MSHTEVWESGNCWCSASKTLARKVRERLWSSTARGAYMYSRGWRLASSWETAGTERGYEASQEMQKHLKPPLLPVRTKDVPLKMAVRTETWTDGSDGTFRQ